MKYIIFLIVLVYSFSLSAQQDVFLHGVVVEQNSKFTTGERKFIANAEIKAIGSSDLSDSQGKFTLAFADKPIGGIVRIFVSKNGYELVNEQELQEAAVLNRKLPIKIVMCKKGMRYETQIAYYKIIKEISNSNHEKKLETLEKGGVESLVIIQKLEKEYNVQITSLQQANSLLLRQLQGEQTKLKEIADKFSVINIDDANKRYKRAFEKFLEKDIISSIAILEEANSLEDLKDLTYQKQSTEAKLDSINENITDIVRQNIFLSNLLLINRQFDKAVEKLDSLLNYKIDTLEINSQKAEIFLYQREYQEALKIYSSLLNSLINIEKKDDSIIENIGFFNLRIGNIYLDLGEHDKANIHFEQSYYSYLKIKNIREDHKRNIAASLFNLSYLGFGDKKSIGNLNKAIEFYSELATENRSEYLPFIIDCQIRKSKFYSVNSKPDSAKNILLSSLDTIGQLMLSKEFEDNFHINSRYIRIIDELSDKEIILNDSLKIDFLEKGINRFLDIKNNLSPIELDFLDIFIKNLFHSYYNIFFESEEYYNYDINQVLEINKQLLSMDNEEIVKSFIIGLAKVSKKYLEQDDIVNYNLIINKYLHKLREKTEKGKYMVDYVDILKDYESILYNYNYIDKSLLQSKLIISTFKEYSLSYKFLFPNQMYFETAMKYCKKYSLSYMVNKNEFIRENYRIILDSLEKEISFYVPDHPRTIKIKEEIKLYKDIINSRDEGILLLLPTKKVNYYNKLKEINSRERLANRKILRQLEIIRQINNDKDFSRSILIEEYDTLIWYYLINNSPEQAEVTTFKALELDPFNNKLLSKEIIIHTLQNNAIKRNLAIEKLRDNEPLKVVLLNDIEKIKNHNTFISNFPSAKSFLAEILMYERDIPQLNKDEKSENKELTNTKSTTPLSKVYYELLNKTSLRTRPDSQAKVIIRLKMGDRVEIINSSDEWWWEVTCQGKKGWVKKRLLKKN